VVADPGFVDAERDDFHLKAGAPAARLGMQPHDWSQAGPRQRGAIPGLVDR
jgi:hypothetical protein